MAVLFFGVTLAPALGFVNVYPFRYSYVADHFQYLAGIGLIALAVGAGATVFQEVGQRGRELGTLAATIVLLLLGTAVWEQAHAYHDLETLWRDTLAKNPNAWLAQNNLGTILRQAGKLEEAIGHFAQAVRIKPDLAEAHYNLGVTLAQLGRTLKAIEHYERCTSSPISPKHITIWESPWQNRAEFPRRWRIGSKRCGLNRITPRRISTGPDARRAGQNNRGVRALSQGP